MNRKIEALPRRHFLQAVLAGSGWLGLRALATGLPASLLLEPQGARSADDEAPHNPQFLILNTSASGDPLNCNAPGTYLDPNIVHPADPRMQKTSLTIGGKAFDAALPWTTLSGVLARTSFVHHQTGTLQHLHEPDVLGLMGRVRAKDMAISAFAEELAPFLDTIQQQPVSVGPQDSSEAISFRGRPQPLLTPTALASVLGKEDGVLGQLTATRDRDLDRLHAFYRAHGNRAQRRFLDDYATSRSQTRKLALELLERLSSIADDGALSQLKAAVVLVQMRITPVVTVHIPFGGDNHFDDSLAQESDETVAGMDALATLMTDLTSAGLADRVTFASMNVFGRTLLKQGPGRSHNQHHHMTLLIGANVRGSVIGGVGPVGDDYGAQAIDSRTGLADEAGDIAVEDSLASAGKTLGVALGVPRARVDAIVSVPSSGQTVGKVIEAAVA